jgi:hypothetical protein
MRGSSGLLNYALIIFLAVVLFFVFMKLYEDQKQSAIMTTTTVGVRKPQLYNKLDTDVFSQQGSFEHFDGSENVQPVTSIAPQVTSVAPIAKAEISGYNNSGDFADVLASVPQSENSGNAVFKTCDLNKVSPEELLPSQNNTQFSNLNPTVASNLQNKNFLEAGAHIGLDTVGQSLRNASYDLRAEVPNPRMNVSPWMNTTIQPDLAKKPLV